LVYSGIWWIADQIFIWCMQGSGGFLTEYSSSVYRVQADDCYEHGLSTTKNALNHGPTRTHRSHGRMWSNPDQEDVPRPGVMAHHKMASLLPFLHRSTMCFSSFSNQIIKKTSTRPCREFPSLLPGNHQGWSPRVMILKDLMTLVLCTKSIGQWPFTLVDRTLVYLWIEAKHSHGYMWLKCDWLISRYYHTNT